MSTSSGTAASGRARAERWVPGLRVARTYQRPWLRKDLVAGAVLCALLVPQGMAYAELAGLPPIYGLYTTIACLVAYAVMGPSPVLVLGPDSALGPLIAVTILPLAMGDTAAAVALASMLALIVGLICLGAGVAKLGFIADLLSMPTRIGYLAGLAVTIVIGQLPALMGVKIDASGVINEIVAIVQAIPDTNPWTLAVGLLSLAIILGLRAVAPRVPGVLVAVVVSILLSLALDLAAHGVVVTGALPQGFPVPTLPSATLAELPTLVLAAIGISLVAIGDTISTSAGFAARRRIEVDGNQELVGIGSANLLASVFQGFPVSTSGSRTAVAEQSGAESQLTGVVAAGLVLVMIVLLPGLVADLPKSSLAAIIIAASISLFDVKGLRRLYAMRRTEFGISIACILGVVFLGVLAGILVAIGLSAILMFIRTWRPNRVVMGTTEAEPGWHDVTRLPDAHQIPGLLVLRWDAELFFANANLFRAYVRTTVTAATPVPRWVVVAAAPLSDIDTTAADVLRELDLELNGRDIHLIFAELPTNVEHMLAHYGVHDTIDEAHLFPTLDSAVQAFLALPPEVVPADSG